MLKQITLLFSLLFFVASYSQSIYTIKDGFEEQIIGKYCSVFQDSTSLCTIDSIVKGKYKFNLNKTDCYSDAFGNDFNYWFKLTVTNQSSKTVHVIDIQNPDINHIDIYQVNPEGRIVSSFENCGDSYSFKNRIKKHRNFAFPFFQRKNTTYDYYIKIYYNGEPVNIPLYLKELNHYHEHTNFTSLVAGTYFAILLFVILLMLASYVIKRNKTTLYYTLFVLSLALFLMGYSGYSFQYLYPDYPLIRNIDQPVFIGLVAFFFIQFSMYFLDIKRRRRLLQSLFKYSKYLVLIQIFMVPVFMNKYLSIDVFQFIYLVSLIAVSFFILVVSFNLALKSTSYKYSIFLIAYIIELFGFIIHFLVLFNVIEMNYFNRYIMYYTILIELIIFSSYLTYDLLKIKRDNVKMSTELNNERQKALFGIIMGEQNERTRLSNELHDGLGLVLSTIKARLTNISAFNDEEQEKLNHVIKEVDNACNDVRIISHNLSPYRLKEDGLESVIDSLFSQLNSSQSIEFKFMYCLEEEEELPFLISASLYRSIQELVQNTLKHSKSTKASLIIEKGSDNYYYVQFKDNGIGFDTTNKKDWGIGLKNIKSKMEYLDGDLIIDSKKEYGTLITIRFTLSPNKA